MPYRVTDISMQLEFNLVSISTNLQEYLHHDAIPPDAEHPEGVPAYDEVRESRYIQVSCKCDPFTPASLSAARTTLTNLIADKLRTTKRFMDKILEIKAGGVLTTLRDNIQARLDALP